MARGAEAMEAAATAGLAPMDASLLTADLSPLESPGDRSPVFFGFYPNLG